MKALRRCTWAGDDPAMIAYHDEEWGTPAHDDRRLFEMLILEGAQAGLSWRTILHKRAAYRRAFDDFDPQKIVRYGDAKVAALLADAGIVRNRLKIQAAITNAEKALEVQAEMGSLDALLWSFTGGKTKKNAWKAGESLPARTPESDAMSKELTRRGFKFVGSTICYALMQSVGIVNDHLVGCFRRGQV